MHRAHRLGIAAAVSALSIAGTATAHTARDVVYIRFHDAQIVVTNARITSVSSGDAAGNLAIVSPGATITVEADYTILFSGNPASYTCPGCLIQFYLAWYPDAAAAGASPINLGLWDGDNPGPGDFLTFDGATSGHIVFTTTAPTVPGDYQIGTADSLQFGFVPTVPGGPGWDASIGIVGPAEDASFFINVANLVPAPQCSTDLNFDGVTNAADFVIFAGGFGSTCN
jgi:hypothetical protein